MMGFEKSRKIKAKKDLLRNDKTWNLVGKALKMKVTLGVRGERLFSYISKQYVSTINYIFYHCHHQYNQYYHCITDHLLSFNYLNGKIIKSIKTKL